MLPTLRYAFQCIPTLNSAHWSHFSIAHTEQSFFFHNEKRKLTQKRTFLNQQLITRIILTASLKRHLKTTKHPACITSVHTDGTPVGNCACPHAVGMARGGSAAAQRGRPQQFRMPDYTDDHKSHTGLWMHRWLLTQTQNSTATFPEITQQSFFTWFSSLV